MKKLIAILTTGMFVLIPPPPVLNDQKIELVQYLRSLYDNHNILQIQTTAPNGNTYGKKGQILIYKNSSTLELWINTGDSTGKVWQKL